MVALHGTLKGCVVNSGFSFFVFLIQKHTLSVASVSFLLDFYMTVDQGCVIYCFLLLFFIQKHSYT